LFGKVISRQERSKSEITPFFRINGYPPDTEEYKELVETNYADWKLEVHGLVEKPGLFSLEELKKMPKKEQITEHSCIQGWTGIAQWGGVPMIEIIKQCKPLVQARYVVFRSYQIDKNGEFYEVISLELANHPQTILAYEMNYKLLPIVYGAPLRLRIETQLGYKMVKWLYSIEFVSGYHNIGKGQGGHREDNMYYDITAGI
jgi:DMSO/TMAO reductase YedYZ molybdopterin-dependent catalytic subunit